MTETILEKLIEHNNWANAQIIQACSALSDEQLDAAPQSATMGSIREILLHLASGQELYLRLLTLPLAQRLGPVPDPPFAKLQESLNTSGEGLLAVARDEARLRGMGLIQETKDGYWVAPWVLMLQVINHATEHREQIKNMLSALGITPPSIDGWDYGVVAEAYVPENKLKKA
jgi:uncharacterized damage-inducible protein DinB